MTVTTIDARRDAKPIILWTPWGGIPKGGRRMPGGIRLPRAETPKGPRPDISARPDLRKG